MSGALRHNPAHVFQKALVDSGLGVATTPTNPASWSVYVGSEPSNPDNVITIYDITGRISEKHGVGGYDSMYGLQLRLRSATLTLGYTKVNAIAVGLDKAFGEAETFYRREVTMADGTIYLIGSVSRTADPLDLGTDGGTTRRRIFTLDLLMTLTKTADP